MTWFLVFMVAPLAVGYLLTEITERLGIGVPR